MSATLLFGGVFLQGCSGNEASSSSAGVDLGAVSADLDLWSAPETFGRNKNYKVEVSEDGKLWTETDVYNVKNGHQLGDKLINRGGATYFGEPYTASLAIFDFTGTVGIRVTYSKTLEKGGYVISPDSYGIKSEQKGNTVTFTLSQNEENPRKIVFRPSGEWEAETLHIMTNVPEGAEAIKETSDNVYVIEEGAEIPLYLPEGKDVYYFKAGMHTLPGGYWVELDLGKMETVLSFDLMTPVLGNMLPGGLCFELQAKTGEGWSRVYRSEGENAENNFNMEKVEINATAQYFRLILTGNFNWTPVGDYRFIHKAYVNELRLYDASGKNVAEGKAVAGAGKDFALVTDGSANTGSYGNSYAGETFSVMDGCTYYLEKGSVVQGSLLGNGREGVVVSGRGILDGSGLEAKHELSEGRNSSIRFEYMKNVLIEGITMMHAPMWMCIVNYSRDVLIDGVNLFGYCTNADGIHFSATENAVATGCFIRTTDDLFVVYHYGDANNLLFKNSVLWSDGGRVLLLGLASTGNITDVKLENCDVINYQNVWDLEEYGGFVQIIATGGKSISGVTIKDVRIDEVRFPIIAQFIQIRAGNNTYGTGFVSDVVLDNVSYASKCMPKSLIGVMVPGGSISNVTLKDVTIEGTKVTANNFGTYFSGDSDISVNFY